MQNKFGSCLYNLYRFLKNVQNISLLNFKSLRIHFVSPFQWCWCAVCNSRLQSGNSALGGSVSFGLLLGFSEAKPNPPIFSAGVCYCFSCRFAGWRTEWMNMNMGACPLFHRSTSRSIGARKLRFELEPKHFVLHRTCSMLSMMGRSKGGGWRQ